MLKTRILTATIMLAVFICALLFSSPVVFAILSAGVIALAFWEWGALLKLSFLKRTGLGVFAFLLCAALSLTAENVLLLRDFPPWCTLLLMLNVLFWFFIAPIWLKQKWKMRGVLGVVLGALILFPLWLSLVQMRNFSNELLVFAMMIVWIADSLAYFAGRAFGKHPLAPTISPGKTKEGALVGVLGVMIYFSVFAFLKQSPAHFSWVPVGIALFLGAIFAALSIVGDLFESLLKRQAQLKDSSSLLPGHGGFLDRLDSLAALLPAFWLMFFFWTFNF